jgi:hypothetical protein
MELGFQVSFFFAAILPQISNLPYFRQVHNNYHYSIGIDYELGMRFKQKLMLTNFTEDIVTLKNDRIGHMQGIPMRRYINVLRRCWSEGIY